MHFTKNQFVIIDEKYINFAKVKDLREQTALEIAAKLRLWDVWVGIFDPLRDSPKSTTLQPMEHLLLLCHPGIDLGVIEIFRQRHQLNKPEQLMQVLEAAAKNGQTVVVSHLYSKLKIKSFREPNGWTVHHYMAKFDHINFFQDVFSHSDLPSSQEIEEWTAVAARYGSMRSLKILLDVLSQRKLLPAAGKKPLLEAVQAGHLKTADLIIHKILDANIPLEASGKRAAHLAVINKDAEMVQLLIERGAKFNLADRKNLTALHYAILYNHEELLISLLAPSKEIEIPADLLHFAAAKASFKMLDLLLKRISNINALDPVKRETALMSAVRANRLANVGLLCLHGASLHIGNSKGETPLLLAAKKYGSLLQLLLSYNPPYQVTNQGENALHLAAMHGQDANVQLLLKHNFDASIPDKAQKTPLMHAQEKKFFDICDILQGKSAQLEKTKETIVSSLIKGEQDSFFEPLKGLPINKPMVFVVPHTGKVSSSILHLIYGLIPERKKEILDNFVQKYQPNIHVATEEGHTLLHIAGIKDQEPPFQNMNVLAPDRKGITPLHLFAQSDSLARFKAVFSEIDPNLIAACLDIEDEEMETPLFYAIQKNRLDIASFLLEKGANPNHRSKKLMTPLGIAIEKNSLPIVRALMEKGASIEVRMGVDGEFPLHLAVRKGFDEIVKHLVENTTNMFQKDRSGKEPIHVAAAEGNRNMVRFLHACGASLFSIDHQGNGLAYFAAQSQCPELLDFLKEHDVPFEPSGDLQPKKAPFHMAVSKANSPMIAQFFHYGADLEIRDSKENSALYYATISKNTEVLELFSQTPLMDEERQVRMSLIAAIQLDSVPQLRILQRELKSIDQPLDISQGLTLLHLACQLGATRIVHHLLKEGADPLLKMYDGTSPFELAVFHDHVEIAHKISSQVTIDPNQKLSSGKNHLHLAAAEGSNSMIALLYLQEADIDSLDAEGCTPLLIAARKDHLNTIKLLLALGAKTTTQSLKGQTLYDVLDDKETLALVTRYEKMSAFCQDLGESRLHAAIRLGDTDALMILARTNDIHQKNKEGREPLHIAATQKNLSILRRLLELEIAPDLEIRDHRGKTPLFIAATETKDPHLVQFLLSLGADPHVETNDGLSILEAVQNDDTQQSAAIFKLLTAI
ncbi:MAG: ankyrin repeat domain-containing protein [Candidatus Rhabdochlamydia sp.]